MELHSFGFTNYKTFRERQKVEIKPLTILVGRNSSGKSVVARLPLLLANGLAGTADSPLSRDTGDLEFGSALSDLIHNRNPHGWLGLEAGCRLGKMPVSLSWKLQHFDEYQLLIITEFLMKIGEEKPLSLIWQGRDPVKEYDAYRLNAEKTPLQGISFTGLLPELTPELYEKIQIKPGFQALLNSKDRLLRKMTYLGPFREKPERFYRFPGGQTRDVGHAGAKAPQVLGNDFLRQKGEVLTAVGKWYEQYLGGWILDLTKHGEGFSIVLRNPHNPSVEVNIADTGTGIAQVLPIVVQRQFEALTCKGQNLEIVEQPELNLHPGAHGNLADLYIEAANRTTIRFMIETHSENFLLRIQLRIAEGTLDPQKVAIYWIDEGTIRTINIDRRGELDSWPGGVFSEDYEEVMRIRQAQRMMGS